MAGFPKPPTKMNRAPLKKVQRTSGPVMGGRAAARPLPTRRNAAPGQMKKAAGAQSARAFAPGQTKPPSNFAGSSLPKRPAKAAPAARSVAPGLDIAGAVGGALENIRRTVTGTSNSPIANAVRNGPNARRILSGGK